MDLVFQATDDCCPVLIRTMLQMVESQKASLPDGFKLELYMSENFMGFFVDNHQADVLKNIAKLFVLEVSNKSKKLLLVVFIMVAFRRIKQKHLGSHKK